MRCGDTAECLFHRREPGAGLGAGFRTRVGGRLELFDERFGLVARESAAGLALREVHRAASVAEVGVTGLLEQAEELLHLALGRGRTRWLSEWHRFILTDRYDTDAATLSQGASRSAASATSKSKSSAWWRANTCIPTGRPPTNPLGIDTAGFP